MTPKSWSALGVVYVIWGSTYLAIALAVETLPPLLAVSTRFILAGGILALVVRARQGSGHGSLRVSWASLSGAVLVGCLLRLVGVAVGFLGVAVLLRPSGGATA